MNINLAWLHTFRLVAEERNYTRAADELSMSQPAVSQHIRQLERCFSAKLFRRVGIELMLTDVGLKVYELANRISTDLEATDLEVKELLSGSHSLVTIVSSPTFFLHAWPPIVESFWANHPEIAVKTIVRLGSDISSAVKHGIADIGIVGGYVDTSLIAHEWNRREIVAICSPEHPLAGQPAIVPTLLSRQRVAITGPNTETRSLVESWLQRQGTSLFKVMEVSSHEEIRIAARSNLAIGFVNLNAVQDDIKDGSLHVLDLHEFRASFATYLIHRKDLQEPATWLIAEILHHKAA